MALTDAQRKDAKRKVLVKRIHNLTVAFVKMDADKEMQFRHEGDTKAAERLIQSMRVKLSRFRNAVRARGKQLADFKMRLHSLAYNPETDITTITLTKTAPTAKAEKDVDDLFKELDL